MINATEKLRAMLDERGVEWWDSRYGEQIVFQSDGVKWFANDGCRDGMLELSTIAITPEQAITATLGSGKLTAEQVADAVLENFEETHETRYDHWEPSKFDWQSIADELNDVLGSGTCKNISDPPEGFLCSECRWGDFSEPSHLLTSAKYTGRISGGPNHCPNCGRKVVNA